MIHRRAGIPPATTRAGHRPVPLGTTRQRGASPTLPASRHRPRRGRLAPVLALVAATLPAVVLAELQTVRYAATTEAFPNPERGWYYIQQPGNASVTIPLDTVDFGALRARNVTMVRQIYVLDRWVDSPLPRSLLDAVEADLVRVREAGVKLIPKFSYNWVPRATPAMADADAGRIRRHLEQLRPVLERHVDVVAFMEEGFVGQWGEWHDSSSGHVEPGTLLLSPTGRATFRRVNDYLPSRIWAARYAEQAMEIYPEPLPAGRAHDGSSQSRLGLFNAGFRSTPNDRGSWSDFDPEREAAQKAWAVRQTRHTVQSGEPAGVPEEVHRDYATSGEGLLEDLERFGYSALALNQTEAYWSGQYRAWGMESASPDTAYAEADRRLGYRYRMVRAELPTDVGAGAPFGINLELANEGWATLYNPRALELVLRPVDGGADVPLPVEPDVDVRKLLPAAGETVTAWMPTTIPADLVPGEYELLVGLPAPELRLRDRAAYAIRLANAGTWEPATGLNRLNARVRVWP